ncbi:gliding motility lipoprotein GldB [Flavobacterium sp. NST-5]|uniref:Gliding motility lipoprotein GldB n=1 Tax=Flavobacterium ichthyis TaxID=2698827 RepID=A0ABW9Z7X9_9FLAO|nr:gliding motility lipoprotein GldB [Flavobacterium ichthyis]NBL64739.1 gliding motility lipoprotein GldB [Flavobacterium ichthyis]
MKKISLLLFLIIAFVNCDKKSKIEKQIEEVPVKLEVERFDKIFYESAPTELTAIKAKFPYFFPAGEPDEVWLAKKKDPLLNEVHDEVQKTFGDFSAETTELESAFQHLKYYYPQTNLPKIVTLISEVDVESRIIYADTLLLISLDVYLGKDHRYYEGFPQYQRKNFEKNQILPDVVQAFAETKTAIPTEKNLLNLLIYHGKMLYFKDQIIPEASDADKIGYTNEELNWSQENEGYIWRYFVDENLLYDNDPKLPGRFVNPAPFSKFYLEIDNESPGRIGQFIGWQIVRSYMKNNDVSLQDLLQKDAKEIFENSKYKPKK